METEAYNSVNPITLRTDESFTFTIYSFRMVGKAFLNAWGITTNTIVLKYDMPKALEASSCPLSTPFNPDRIISDM